MAVNLFFENIAWLHSRISVFGFQRSAASHADSPEKKCCRLSLKWEPERKLEDRRPTRDAPALEAP
jgi:hypothetical protein